jgi:hypothetical protein
LLSRLLGLVMVTLAFQQLDDLIFIDVHARVPLSSRRMASRLRPGRCQ